MTILEEFKANYPNAKICREKGSPTSTCVIDLGYEPCEGTCSGHTCTECWSQQLPEKADIMAEVLNALGREMQLRNDAEDKLRKIGEVLK